MFRIHGGYGTSTYRSWTGMISRCEDPNYRAFHRYGGRGITVCRRWRDSFVTFREDMGERPPKMSLDRIDNNGNYEPGNCRWATRVTQNRNHSTAKLTEEDARQIRCCLALGVTQRWLAATFGVHQATINRVNLSKCWR